MEVLQMLATALGVSAMAGINLYLTVFATSLALNMGWLQLSPAMQPLQVLSDPSIMMISGFLYFLEFFVDKTPGLDSLWDTIHTAIRPLGAVLLSLALLGQTDVTLEIVVALLCGTTALSTHATKMGVRAVINTSPEPFSNAAASVAEDVIVAGGLVTVYTHPIAAGVGVLIFLVMFCWFAPKIFRFVRMVAVLAFKNLYSDSCRQDGKGIGMDMTTAHREELAGMVKKGLRPAWSVYGFTGKTARYPSGLPCYLLRFMPPMPQTGAEDSDGDEKYKTGAGKPGSDDSGAGRPAEEGRERSGSSMGIFIPGKKELILLESGTEKNVRHRFLFSEITFFDNETQCSHAVRISKKCGKAVEEALSSHF